MTFEDRALFLAGDSFRVVKPSEGTKPLLKDSEFPLTVEERSKSGYGAIRAVFKRLRLEGYSTKRLKIELCISKPSQ